MGTQPSEQKTASEQYVGTSAAADREDPATDQVRVTRPRVDRESDPLEVDPLGLLLSPHIDAEGTANSKRKTRGRSRRPCVIYSSVPSARSKSEKPFKRAAGTGGSQYDFESKKSSIAVGFRAPSRSVTPRLKPHSTVASAHHGSQWRAYAVHPSPPSEPAPLQLRTASVAIPREHRSSEHRNDRIAPIPSASRVRTRLHPLPVPEAEQAAASNLCEAPVDLRERKLAAMKQLIAKLENSSLGLGLAADRSRASAPSSPLSVRIPTFQPMTYSAGFLLFPCPDILITMSLAVPSPFYLRSWLPK